MMATSRLILPFRRSLAKPQFSTAAFDPPKTKVVVQKLGFRSTLMGFLAGSVLTGIVAFEYLVEDYKGSSYSLLVGVEELSKNTKEVP